MEKEFCTIAGKLKDVPEGSCVDIRRPLGTSDIVKTVTSEGVPDDARLKSDCIPASNCLFTATSRTISISTTVMASPSCPSITAVPEGSDGK